MINLSYTVAGQLIEPASVPQYLVADTVGVYQVAFTFDADWADMGEKTVVFRNPQVIDPDYRDVPVEFPLDANGQALVPAALLDPGKLFIGVYGTNSTQQLPTIWAPPLQVVPGASPGVEPSDDPALGSVIRTIPQTLTEEEKAQARENIGANEIQGGTPGNVVIIGSNGNIEDGGFKFSDAFPVGSASGAVATFTDGANGVPVKEMTVQINPVQAGTGDPSPSNIRPISGWTESKILHTNENLFNAAGTTAQTTGATVTVIGKDEIHVTSQPLTSSYPASKQLLSAYNTLEGGKTYKITAYVHITKGIGYMAIRNSNNAGVYISEKITTSGMLILTFTMPTTLSGEYISFFSDVKNNQGSDVTYSKITMSEVQTVIPITFPSSAGTVYGGSLTVREDGTGNMYVNMAGVKPNNLTVASPIAHGTASSSKAFSLPISAYPATVVASAKRNSISEISKQETAYYGANRNSQANSYIYAIGTAGNFIRIYDPDLTITDADFMTKYGDRIYIYEIEPVTYDLTASQVSTLLGLNTIWGDTGDISITYRADPTLATAEQATAIKESIAYYQTDYTAKHAYVVNDLVYVGDVLYIVISAIAQGATMTPNTNCLQTTLNAVIKSLR